MKKLALIAVIGSVGLLAQNAFATITFSMANPTQTVAAGSGTFTETLQLSVTQNSSPANIAGYDLVLEALASQNGGIANGQFQVTGVTLGSNDPNGWAAIATYPDSFTSVGTDRSGYVQTGDEGLSNSNASQNFSTPVSGFTLATYTISYSGLAANKTYTFDTTATAANGGGSSGKFSDVADSGGAIYGANNSATFSITTAVPEPATWSLLGLGGLGSLGLTMLRARRKAA